MKNPLLFELIQSLSKNEKGYFVKQNSAKNNYFLALFNSIEQQKKYDETSIKQQFKGTYIAKNFSFAKNYLYNSILKTLIQYNLKNHNKYFYFNSVENLYQKGMYKHCEKLLIQFYKKAIKTNDYLSILRIIEFSKLILASNLRYSEKLKEIVKQEQIILKKQQVTSTFQSILMRIKKYRENIGNIMNDESSQLKELTNNTFLKNKLNIIDLHCEKMYHEILFLHGFTFNNYDIALFHSKKLRKIIFEDEQNNFYLTTFEKFELISHIIRFNILLNDFNLALKNIETSNLIVTQDNTINPTEKNIMLLRNIIFKTDVFILSKNTDLFNKAYNQGINLVKQNKLKHYAKQLYKILLANRICNLFLNNDYKSTLVEINNILNQEKKDLRSDIVLFIKLTEMAIFYDKEDINLLKSRIISFKRDLHKLKVKDELWQVYYNLFSSLKNNKFNQSDLIKTTKKIESTPKTRLRLDLFHIEDWVEQKLMQLIEEN